MEYGASAPLSLGDSSRGRAPVFRREAYVAELKLLTKAGKSPALHIEPSMNARRRDDASGRSDAVVQVYDDAGRALLLRLLAMNPEWEVGLEAGHLSDNPSETVHPRLRIPSAHPTIHTPLTVELGGTLQLFWHGGYFFDFVGEDPAADAFEFLQRFFAEEVRCGVCWRDGKVVAGGPVEEDAIPLWVGDHDRIEVCSWRGNRDKTAKG